MVAPARSVRPAEKAGDPGVSNTVNRSTEGKPRQSRPRPGGRESAAARAARAERICERLAEAYPDASCSLDFRSPFELVVATILSAQCTDRRVNMVTVELFRRWPSPARMAAAPPAALEEVIRTTGFFRAKAKNVLGCCQALVERHGGEVPRTLPELVKLPGVGRKTANVVLGSAFGIPSGVVVDTHVGRIARRLGLTRQADAVRAERDLIACLPESRWIEFSHRLIALGRAVCTARKPRCEACPLADLCPRKGVATGGAKAARNAAAPAKRNR
jgi:endonuclease-3